MRGNPIETAQYLGFHSPAKQLSVPSCGAIPSKQRGVQEKINPIRTFSPLMRGNPIETGRFCYPVLLYACLSVPSCGAIPSKHDISEISEEICLSFQSPHAGQSHRNLGMSPDLEERWSLSVPSCGAIPSKPPLITSFTTWISTFQSPHAGQSHRNRPIDKAHSSVDT